MIDVTVVVTYQYLANSSESPQESGCPLPAGSRNVRGASLCRACRMLVAVLTPVLINIETLEVGARLNYFE